MDLKLTSTTVDNSVLSKLYSAQLIANTFTKGLEDNDCLLISLVQLHDKINSNYKDIIEQQDNYDNTPTTLVNKANKDYNNTAVLNPLIQDLIQNSKDKCFDCKPEYSFPSIKFNSNFNFGELEVSINLYKDLFKLGELNPCQAIDILKNQCIPDILKLIVLLLNAYLMITSLRKLSSLSLNSFIKGIISILVGKLIANINISINLGQLNLNCFIDYLKNIQEILPTNDNIVKGFTSEQVAPLLTTLPDNVVDSLVQEYFKGTLPQKVDGKYSIDVYNELANKIPREKYAGLLDTANINPFNSILTTPVSGTLSVSEMLDIKSAQNRLNNFNIASLDKSTKDVMDKINKSKEGLDNLFKELTSVVDDAVSDFNSYIEQILSLKAYFECEVNRSSDNTIETLRKLKKLIDMINMLSSIVYGLAKKEARDRCVSKNTYKSLTKSEVDTNLLKDVLQDYNKKVVEVIKTDDSNIQVIIYDKPFVKGLPKISLLDCSIKDFIDDHRLDVIMDNAVKDVLDEEKEIRKTVDNDPWVVYTYKDILATSSVAEEIKNLTDILYSKPTVSEQPPAVGEIKETVNITPNFNNIDNNLKTNTVKCTSIEDVLNTLDLLQRG